MISLIMQGIFLLALASIVIAVASEVRTSWAVWRFERRSRRYFRELERRGAGGVEEGARFRWNPAIRGYAWSAGPAAWGSPRKQNGRRSA